MVQLYILIDLLYEILGVINLYAIEVTNLKKRYGKVQALRGTSFKVKKGSITAILGSNGSGKTTTIKSICNLIIPEEGEIKLLGKSNKKQIKHLSALFEGTRNLYWRLTPVENLRYFAGIRGMGGAAIDKRIEELLELFNLSSKKNVPVNNLSKGMQQKVAIAMTLICDTEIIILDEPTLGLDVESVMQIKELLRHISKELHKTIFLSTHDLKVVEDICDDVIILSKGKVVAEDSVKNLLSKHKRFTYEISIADGLDEQLEFINSKEGWYLNQEEKKLEMDIYSLKELYDMIETLKERGILISEIKEKSLDLERIFLSLTKTEVV